MKWKFDCDNCDKKNGGFVSEEVDTEPSGEEPPREQGRVGQDYENITVKQVSRFLMNIYSVI